MFKNKILNFKKSYSFNSLLLAITQSFIAFFFLIMDFFYSKELTVEKFGIWKELILVISMMIPIFSFGIAEGYKYYLAKENRPKEIFANTFIFYSVITICLFVIVLFLNYAHYLGLINLRDYYLISFLLPIAYFAFALNKTLRYGYINEGKVLLHTKITLVSHFVTSLLVGLVYYHYHIIKANYLVIGLFLYIFLYTAPIIFLILKNNLVITFKWLNKNYFIKVLKQGIPLYLATFIGVLTLNMDKIIVRSFENAEVFAVFLVGALEIPVFAMLSAAFSQNIYPKLVKQINTGKKEQAKKLWLETTKRVSFITYPMILILMFLSEDIIYFIYSPKYEDSVVLFQTYLLIGLFRNNYYGAIITASGNTKYITLYSAMMLVFNLIFSLVLYFVFGLKGVVFGTLLSTFLIMALQLKHENLLKKYFYNFLLDYRIIIMIIIILAFYFNQILL